MTNALSPRLSPAQLKVADFERRSYRCVVPSAVTPKDILAPEYWTHVSRQLKKYDHIEVIWEDGTYRAELFVTDAADLYTKVAIINAQDLSKGKEKPAAAPKADVPGYSFKFMGTNRHCVIRDADKEIVFKGGADRAAAEKGLEEYLAALNA